MQQRAETHHIHREESEKRRIRFMREIESCNLPLKEFPQNELDDDDEERVEYDSDEQGAHKTNYSPLFYDRGQKLLS